ncbi:MAG: sugar ABC transporter ATP-binding protein [Acidobacteriota bacterium]
MLSPVLKMAGITKRFPGVLALDSVDLEIYPAEILALIGENGAGKSTLMKVLGGIYTPEAGVIYMDDRTVAIRSVSDAINFGIGLVHQELNVLENIDIAGNIFLGREPVWGGPLKLIDRPRIFKQTREYLGLLGMDLSPDTLLRELSIAQQQMVEIARALSLNARILIMDEPTSSLTVSESERLFQVARDLKARGVSIVYISHRLSEIENFADRVVVLRDGVNAGSLAGAEISHDRMVRLMVGRDLDHFYTQQGIKSRGSRLEVRGLCTRRYRQQAVSFSIGQGEILGFAGLIGAGRSEVAEAIFGVQAPVEGQIRLDGTPVQIRSPKHAIREGIYLIPEDRRIAGLITEMSVRENVTLPDLTRYASAGWIRRQDERDAASRQCASLNVKVSSLEQKVAHLSGGNQQKVVLAKWLSLGPRCLIFDEPTRGIDVAAKAEIYKLMRDLAESGVAILMISSDMEEVLAVSDRIAVMHEGRIGGVLEPSEFSEENVMRLAVGERQ